MSRFFVGQRVRMARPITHPEMQGLQGSIRELRSIAACVDWDNGISDLVTHWFWTSYESIEPLAPIEQPCESEFKESLDRLLEGLPA